MKGTFTVAGQRVRSASIRRYHIFLVYTKANGGQGVEIYRRTDQLSTARRIVANYGWSATRKLVIVDTTTGEQV